MKNLSDKDNRFKRINVKKISSIKSIIDKPFKEIEFISQTANSFTNVSKLSKEKAKTEVKIVIKNKGKNLIFKLKDKRYIDRKVLGSLKNKDISTLIK